MNDALVCSWRFFPVSGQGRPSKISPAPWIGAHKGRGVDEVRGKTVVADEGKPILQTDLKFSNSNSVAKDQQDAVGNLDGAPLLENSIVVSISHNVAHDASILLTQKPLVFWN